MTVADDHLARIGAALDECEGDDAAHDLDQSLPDCAREALALSAALQPVIVIALKLGAGQALGVGADEDASWAASVALARSEVLARQAGGTDHGLAADNLRLLDRIETLLGVWPNGDWEDDVRCRVQELVDARQQGAQRGKELRQARAQTEVEDRFSVGWPLRNPTDHWLRAAVQAVSDPECRMLETQIAKLEPTYRQLCRLDWSAEEAAAGVVCDMQVVSVTSGRWNDPVSAVVTAPIKGETSRGQQVAVRLVEDPDATFNGTLVSFLPDERWRICARVLEDDTLLPLDGTRRLAISRI